jgi:succinate dehydrogenase / fumarate reductase, cytochrome b subunit
MSSTTSTTKQRPLSPFMLYRWQYTNTLSILHRLTGLALSLGAVLLVYWLAAAAAGAAAYQRAQMFFGHPLMRAALVAVSFAFFYHLLNGVRHLIWDLGYGLERKTARASGWAVFVSALAVTILFWVVVNLRDGAGAL